MIVRSLSDSLCIGQVRPEPDGRGVRHAGRRWAMIVVDSESTRDEIAEAIGHVRAKHAACEDDQLRAEIAADMDDLLDRWAAARA